MCSQESAWTTQLCKRFKGRMRLWAQRSNSALMQGEVGPRKSNSEVLFSCTDGRKDCSHYGTLSGMRSPPLLVGMDGWGEFADFQVVLPCLAALCLMFPQEEIEDDQMRSLYHAQIVLQCISLIAAHWPFWTSGCICGELRGNRSYFTNFSLLCWWIPVDPKLGGRVREIDSLRVAWAT